MFDQSLSTVVAMALCLVLATYVQSVTGFAFGLVFLGLVSVFDLVPISEAANVITLTSLVQAFVYFRQQPLLPDVKVIRPAIVPSLVGVAAGAFFLLWLSGNAMYLLRLFLGSAIIASAISLVVHVRHRRQIDKPGVFALTGLVSGIMGGMFSTAGPPLVYVMYRQPLQPEVIRQCLLLMFAIGQVLRLLMVIMTSQFQTESLAYAVLAVPLVYLVTHANRRFPLRMSHCNTLRLAAILLMASGSALVMSSL